MKKMIFFLFLFLLGCTSAQHEEDTEAKLNDIRALLSDINHKVSILLERSKE